VAPLRAVLADRSAAEDARLLASEILQKTGSQDPSLRQECVAAILAELARFEENSHYFNGRVIADLVLMKAVIAAPTIERAYRANRVDDSFAGTWDEVRRMLGVGSD